MVALKARVLGGYQSRRRHVIIDPAGDGLKRVHDQARGTGDLFFYVVDKSVHHEYRHHLRPITLARTLGSGAGSELTSHHSAWLIAI